MQKVALRVDSMDCYLAENLAALMDKLTVVQMEERMVALMADSMDDCLAENSARSWVETMAVH